MTSNIDNTINISYETEAVNLFVVSSTLVRTPTIVVSTAVMIGIINQATNKKRDKFAFLSACSNRRIFCKQLELSFLHNLPKNKPN